MAALYLPHVMKVVMTSCTLDPKRTWPQTSAVRCLSFGYLLLNDGANATQKATFSVAGVNHDYKHASNF